MPPDFSGQNLRGRNFKGQDLTGANFSYADIRGANFSNAILIGANFTKAKAGLQRRWGISLSVISSILAGLSAIFIGCADYVVLTFFAADNIKDFTFIPGAIVLAGFAIAFIVTIRQGIWKGLVLAAVLAFY